MTSLENDKESPLSNNMVYHDGAIVALPPYVVQTSHVAADPGRLESGGGAVLVGGDTDTNMAADNSLLHNKMATVAIVVGEDGNVTSSSAASDPLFPVRATNGAAAAAEGESGVVGGVSSVATPTIRRRGRKRKDPMRIDSSSATPATKRPRGRPRGTGRGRREGEEGKKVPS